MSRYEHWQRKALEQRCHELDGLVADYQQALPHIPTELIAALAELHHVAANGTRSSEEAVYTQPDSTPPKHNPSASRQLENIARHLRTYATETVWRIVEECTGERATKRRAAA